MKKILFVFLIALLALTVNKVHAQIELGAGLLYNTDVERIGLNLRGVFYMTEKVDLAAKLDWIFPKEFSGVKIAVGDVSGDLHYLFRERETCFSPYGIVGIHLLAFSFKSIGETYASTYLGLNFGTGFEFAISKSIGLFAESKYSLILHRDVKSPFVFSAGVNYSL